MSGAIPSLVVPSCRNYSIQQTLHLASQLPTNNLVLGTMLDYKLRYGLFTRELTLRHSFISWWTLKFINGGTFTAIEGQLCTLLQRTSTLSNNEVLILARINCSHFRWWSYFPGVKRYFKVFLHDLGNKNYQWSRKLFHHGRICQLTLSYMGGGGVKIHPLLFFLHHLITAQSIKLKLSDFKDTLLRHILQVKPVR